MAFVNLIRDRFGRTSQGFGYISMPVQSEAEKAIHGMHGKELKGTTIVVREATPRKMADPAPVKQTPQTPLTTP